MLSTSPGFADGAGVPPSIVTGIVFDGVTVNVSLALPPVIRSGLGKVVKNAALASCCIRVPFTCHACPLDEASVISRFDTQMVAGPLKGPAVTIDKVGM
jgi:hypothetical protein